MNDCDAKVAHNAKRKSCCPADGTLRNMAKIDSIPTVQCDVGKWKVETWRHVEMSCHSRGVIQVLQPGPSSSQSQATVSTELRIRFGHFLKTQRVFGERRLEANVCCRPMSAQMIWLDSTHVHACIYLHTADQNGSFLVGRRRLFYRVPYRTRLV